MLTTISLMFLGCKSISETKVVDKDNEQPDVEVFDAEEATPDGDASDTEVADTGDVGEEVTDVEIEG